LNSNLNKEINLENSQSLTIIYFKNFLGDNLKLLKFTKEEAIALLKEILDFMLSSTMSLKHNKTFAITISDLLSYNCISNDSKFSIILTYKDSIVIELVNLIHKNIIEVNQSIVFQAHILIYQSIMNSESITKLNAVVMSKQIFDGLEIILSKLLNSSKILGNGYEINNDATFLVEV